MTGIFKYAERFRSSCGIVFYVYGLNLKVVSENVNKNIQPNEKYYEAENYFDTKISKKINELNKLTCDNSILYGQSILDDIKELNNSGEF